jgi:hypothetical protein
VILVGVMSGSGSCPERFHESVSSEMLGFDRWQRLASRLESEPTMLDAGAREDVQHAAYHDGNVMQQIGALLLELGRATLSLRMGQSPVSFPDLSPYPFHWSRVWHSDLQEDEDEPSRVCYMDDLQAFEARGSGSGRRLKSTV